MSQNQKKYKTKIKANLDGLMRGLDETLRDALTALDEKILEEILFIYILKPILHVLALQLAIVALRSREFNNCINMFHHSRQPASPPPFSLRESP